MTVQNDEIEAAEVLAVARQTIQTTLAQPTDVCPRALPLLRYALDRRRERAAPLSQTQRTIGLHKAFCGYCTQRYRLFQAALQGVSSLSLRAVLQKAGSGARLLRELGEGLTQTIDALLFNQPIAAPLTLGKRNRRLDAQVLDVDGRAVGTATLQVEQGPEVQGGQFLLTLRTADPQHEGARVVVNLVLDRQAGLELELDRARVREGSVTLKADVGALGLAVEPRLPLALVQVGVQI